jgi:hypothetical protein
MKLLLLLTILFSGILSNGQSRKDSSAPAQNPSRDRLFGSPGLYRLGLPPDTAVLFQPHNDNNLVLCYLDGKLLVDAPLLDIGAIAGIKVERGFDAIYRRNGKIYLTSKNPGAINLLSINDIKNKYAITTDDSQLLWMVDNEFVERIQYFRIDSAYLYKLRLQDLNFGHLSRNLSQLKVARIFTKTAENIAKFSPQLRLRGQE